MAPAPEPEDLRALGAKLDEVRRQKAEQNRKPAPSGMGVAMRFATELVVALCVGGAIGYGLDTVLHTKPIFLMVFFLAGAAAGIRNVMQAAKELNKDPASGTDMPDTPDDDEER